MDDVLSDFNPATSHLFVCLKNEGSEMPCNRECLHRLMDVAARQARVLRGEPCPTCTVGPSRATVGMVCQTCYTDHGVSGNAPECDGHNETQKRDGKPPWCTRCGWTHGQPARPARKIGRTAEERLAGARHQPWTPSEGYASPPRSSMGDRDDEPGSTHQRASQPLLVCGHKNVKHRLCLDCGAALT